MRGFAGNTINMPQDGVPVAASTIVTRDVDTWKYERIEVLKGPSSVLYGEGALGSAVNEYSGYSSTQVYIGAPRSAELGLTFNF